jgi:hypothetical protein
MAEDEDEEPVPMTGAEVVAAARNPETRAHALRMIHQGAVKDLDADTMTLAFDLAASPEKDVASAGGWLVFAAASKYGGRKKVAIDPDGWANALRTSADKSWLVKATQAYLEKWGALHASVAAAMPRTSVDDENDDSGYQSGKTLAMQAVETDDMVLATELLAAADKEFRGGVFDGVTEALGPQDKGSIAKAKPNATLFHMLTVVAKDGDQGREGKWASTGLAALAAAGKTPPGSTTEASAVKAAPTKSKSAKTPPAKKPAKKAAPAKKPAKKPLAKKPAKKAAAKKKRR